ncbi:acetyl-CoA carboxylase biotin carboxylase subunit [Acanthopleuribacter pedis]|uniref:Acetyl-CoA carboxylase biotin carboxylase subunit n=1 Tax=Acanthopleuribacter pedis TaxID=442870 RepID=A0A8J7U0L1_9BACT|nr:acetyl-CoA carboxylase biotin carboxylase subunit [Acanthopleuribacter pedis]MBO1317193.1 acetyl-CoA carboxylase biotin carboxylase subunit [Acanthopleuribacter pedis]
MFKKVLIANRGEIAIRVIRCLREHGIQSVAVYSDPDRDSLAVRYAHQAVHLPGNTSAETYMDIEKVLDAAKRTGCEAIHPGYGFLSEKAEFSQACRDAGIAFIGPHPESISSMGDKTTARELMIKAGVPVTPGFQNENGDRREALQAAQEMGFPVMIKASAGGGGKGMRRVDRAEDFLSNYDMAASEAKSAFGDDRIYIEKFIQNPRHIEVQIACDKHGNAIHLAERECSVQRRHQKVVEEAPSPAVTPEMRAKIGEIAIQAALAVNYDSVGTIEFLMDKDNNFFFMEMNTRLQVEHPVTEWITGVDLVRLQLQIAAGEKLPFSQDDITITGHSVECRVYAEDPEKNFMPSPGKITSLLTPSGLGVRDDSGVYPGYEVPIYYDPMISKLTTWGRDREEAILRMSRALGEYRVGGIKTNLWFHRALMQHPAWLAADLDTAFIERHPELLHKGLDEGHIEPALIAAAIKHYKTEARRGAAGPDEQTQNSSQWKAGARLAVMRYRSL